LPNAIFDFEDFYHNFGRNLEKKNFKFIFRPRDGNEDNEAATECIDNAKRHVYVSC